MMEYRYVIINDSLFTALDDGYLGQRVRILDLDNELVVDKDGNQFTAVYDDLYECRLKQYPAPTFISVITFTQPTDMVVGDPDQALVASSTGNPAPITFASSDITKATIVSGGTALHAVAAGTVNITASQAASTGFTAATDVVLAVTIT
jgi:uncharacterized protein YjdB